jgi:hypothetical protein
MVAVFEVNQAARESILESQVNAALAGYDIGPFEPGVSEAGRGWQARCRRCDRSVWVGRNRVMYSLLGECFTGRTG